MNQIDRKISQQTVDAEFKTDMDNISLRKGKWIAEEEEYANRIISLFNKGLLSIPAGTTLRSLLSEKLHCDPMRITKKYAGASCIGKQIFQPFEATPENVLAVRQAEAQLELLQASFLERLGRRGFILSPVSSHSSSSSSHTDNSSLDSFQLPPRAATTTATGSTPKSTSVAPATAKGVFVFDSAYHAVDVDDYGNSLHSSSLTSSSGNNQVRFEGNLRLGPAATAELSASSPRASLLGTRSTRSLGRGLGYKHLRSVSSAPDLLRYTAADNGNSLVLEVSSIPSSNLSPKGMKLGGTTNRGESLFQKFMIPSPTDTVFVKRSQSMLTVMDFEQYFDNEQAAGDLLMSFFDRISEDAAGKNSSNLPDSIISSGSRGCAGDAASPRTSHPTSSSPTCDIQSGAGMQELAMLLTECSRYERQQEQQKQQHGHQDRDQYQQHQQHSQQLSDIQAHENTSPQSHHSIAVTAHDSFSAEHPSTQKLHPWDTGEVKISDYSAVSIGCGQAILEGLPIEAKDRGYTIVSTSSGGEAVGETSHGNAQSLSLKHVIPAEGEDAMDSSEGEAGEEMGHSAHLSEGEDRACDAALKRRKLDGHCS